MYYIYFYQFYVCMYIHVIVKKNFLKKMKKNYKLLFLYTFIHIYMYQVIKTNASLFEAL